MIIYNDYYNSIKKYIESNTPREYYIGRGKRAELFNFIPMGFDTETSTIYKKDENGKVIYHLSWVYIWQWQIGDNTYIGRDYESLHEIINAIKTLLCNGHRKTICFIHNMSFEFQFIARQLLEYGHITEVFARKKRKPMKWTIDDSIVFLDSALLTHLPLALLAENYCKTQKLVGDLDYSLVRTSKTKLEEKELQYCINDVVILKEYAEFYETNYLTNKFMPMTQTMIANLAVKDSISELKCNSYVWNMMSKLYPENRKQYEYLMLFYSGAYTHGMLKNLFITLYNGVSFDVTSEYPYVMMSKYFPMGKFHKLNDLTKIDVFLENYCCLCDVILTNIKTKYGVTILSKNKLIDVINPVYDNGRLYKADSVRAFLTEVDILTLKMHYNFKIKYLSCIYSKRGFLPDYIRLAVAKLYASKSKLKNVKGKEKEYLASKESLNGQYGSMCTKLTFEEITFTNEWSKEDIEVDFSKVWKSKNKLPSWAIYVTSHARNLVLTPVYEICKVNPNDYWYTDTDSVKASNKDYIIKIFNDLSKEIYIKNNEWVNHLGLREKYPDIDFCEIGTFDREKDLVKFKTLGSKRYIYTTPDGEFKQTVAGLPKGVFKKYCDDNDLDYYEAFTENGIFLSDEQSTKLVAYYNDNIEDIEVTDYKGNTEQIHVNGCVSLIPTTFNLNVTTELQRLYMEVQKD